MSTLSIRRNSIVCVCVCFDSRDDDMLSIASMLSVSNLSMIGNLEDDDEDGFGWSAKKKVAV